MTLNCRFLCILRNFLRVVYRNHAADRDPPTFMKGFRLIRLGLLISPRNTVVIYCIIMRLGRRLVNGKKPFGIRFFVFLPRGLFHQLRLLIIKRCNRRNTRWVEEGSRAAFLCVVMRFCNYSRGVLAPRLMNRVSLKIFEFPRTLSQN